MHAKRPMKISRRQPLCRRAFALLETIIGMAIAAAAISVAAGAMSQYRSGMRQMIAQQNLKAQANAALLAMRTGQKPAVDEGVTLEVRVQHASPLTLGRVWVQMKASRDGKSATVWGLAPETAAQPAKEDR